MIQETLSGMIEGSLGVGRGVENVGILLLGEAYMVDVKTYGEFEVH